LVLEVTGRGPKIVEPTDQKIEDGQLEGLAHELENKLGRKTKTLTLAKPVGRNENVQSEQLRKLRQVNW
jgi:hypothetical protein